MSFAHIAPDRNKVTSVQLDTVTIDSDVDEPDAFATEINDAIVEGRPITWRVTDPHGPGGGNPVLEFTGPEYALLEMMVAHYSLDPTEAFDLYGIGTPDEMPESMDSLASSVKMLGTPDKLIGLEDAGELWDGWDWVAGYSVMRTAKGEHGGQPATRITLGDSDGAREVGRLVLRNDALRGSVLEWVRQFESDEARDEFIARFNAASDKPAGLGDDWEKVEARTINEGDTVLDMSDMRTAARVDGIEFTTIQSIGLPLIQLICGKPISDVMNFGLREEVWVKRA